MSGWNKPTGKPVETKKAAKPALKHVLIASGVVAVLGCVLLLVFSGGDDAPKAKTEKKAGVIKEVKPAAAPKAERHVETPEEKEKLRRLAGGEYTNDYGYVYNRKIRGPVFTNDLNKTFAANMSFASKVFDNSVDQEIGSLLDAEPGDMFVGDASSTFGPAFTRKFLKSLESPIIISKDDPPDVASLKKAVREAKIELKAYYDEGKDVGEILLAERKNMQHLGEYRQELMDELDRISRNRELSEADIKDFVSAANAMLTEKGAKPLGMPRSAALRFERMRQRQAAQDSASKSKNKED